MNVVLRDIEIGYIRCEKDFVSARRVSLTLLSEAFANSVILQDHEEAVIVSSNRDKAALELGKQMLAALDAASETQGALMQEIMREGGRPPLTMPPTQVGEAMLLAHLK